MCPAVRFAVAAFAVIAAGVPALAAQDLPESSPIALMHHAQGVDAYVKDNYAEAIRHFRMAYDSDPTSWLSVFMAGVAAGNAGQLALADSFYAAVAPHKDQLSTYYRYRLEAQMAGRKGEIAALIELNRKAAQLGAGTKAWYNVAQAGVPRGDAAEGREALRKLDPDKEPMKGWFSYIAVYTGAAHQLGDHDDELAMALRGRANYPNDIRAVGREVIALAALNRVDEAEAVLASARTMPAFPGTTYGDVTSTFGLELMAHGKPAAGRKWLETSLQWFDTQPADVMKPPAMRGARGFALYALGRCAELPSLFAGLIAEQPNNVAWKAWSGVAAACVSDKAKALDVSNRIGSRDINIPVNGPGWQALIAAGLGDRAGALGYLTTWGMKPEWVHRDPNLTRVLGKDLTEYLKSH